MDIKSIIDNPLRFKLGDGSVSKSNLILRSSGEIEGGVDEISWKTEDGALLFFDKEGKNCTRFDSIIFESPERWQMYGSGFSLEKKNRSIRILEPLTAGHWNHLVSKINIEIGKNFESEALLVIFNSAGCSFGSRGPGGTRWEFFGLPISLSMDFVRFSESGPAHWYLYDVQYIIDSITGLINSGKYKYVFMCGMSSGGYAGIFYSEKLSDLHPTVNFVSLAINPQTGHAPEHRKFLRESIKENLPAIISDDCYAARSHDETDIRNIILNRDDRENLKHKIFYDSLNAAEQYYAEMLTGLKQVNTFPHKLGMNHFDGCMTLFNLDVISNGILEELGGKRLNLDYIY
ncbi:hypothetical protein [Burkholderia cepacia]|uniref:hypothetical protein n=1 Tax=Burkholderia cepacia TaxID=292 RepID=UPI001FC81902|nr:hypothetical protein [Burkholderia cepacia]